MTIILLFFILLFNLGNIYGIRMDQDAVWNEAISLLPNQAGIKGLLEDAYPRVELDSKRVGAQHRIIKTEHAPYAYLIGHPTDHDLQEIAAWLKSYDKVLFLCHERFHTYFLQQGFTLQPRMQLLWPANKQPKMMPIPDGYTLQLIDSIDLLQKCSRCSFITLLYGTPERFFYESFGYALVNDAGVPIAEIYGYFVAGGYCDISIVTHPDFRGNGHAALIVPYFIEECLRRNLAPVWNCNVENTGSWKTALKVGFEVDRYYAFLKK